MNEKDYQLKMEVMSRVKAIHYMRTVMRPFLVKAGLFVGGFVGMATLVSIPNVIHNMIESGDYAQFVYHAFVAAELSVEVLIGFVALVFAVLMSDVVKSMKYVRMLRLA